MYIPTTLVHFDEYKTTFSLFIPSPYSLVVFVTMTKVKTMLDW